MTGTTVSDENDKKEAFRIRGRTVFLKRTTVQVRLFWLGTVLGFAIGAMLMWLLINAGPGYTAYISVCSFGGSSIGVWWAARRHKMKAVRESAKQHASDSENSFSPSAAVTRD